MINRFIALGLISLVTFGCKKEKQVVSVNEQGQEMVVNEHGDTVVWTDNSAIVADTDNSVFQNNTDLSTSAPNSSQSGKALAPDTQGLYNFHFELVKGEEYPFSISSNTSNTQKLGTESMTLRQNQVTSLVYKVKDVTPTGYLLEVTYKRFQESVTDGKETLGFDTNAGEPKDEAGKMRWKFNKALVGNSFTMDVSNRGNVNRVDGLEAIRSKARNSISTGLNAEERKGLDEFLKMSINEEMMKAMFEESFAYYPPKPVRVGESWDRTEGDKNASAKVTYTFTGVNNGIANISVNGSSTGSDSETVNEGPQKGLKLSRKLTGSVKGNLQISERTGWIQTANLDRTENLSITQQFENQKETMTSTTTTKTKIN
ncbi:MAG: DUF6263 family protein [Weeksellaceae bacterium]|nr:DUF6263 family protein [Weeksellaceae bacterium]